MGLDISVYTDAKSLPVQPIRDTDGFWPDAAWESDAVLAYGPEAFGKSLRGLVPDTWYSASYDHGFAAGSYSGYNRFREVLCRAALNVNPEDVWHAPETYADSVFYELINFSDAEGTIGPEAAVDLYRDFVENEERVLGNAQLEDQDREWFARKYADWKNAFRVASEGHGIVRFH